MIPRPRFSGSNPIEAFAKARQDIVAPSSSTWTDWTGGTAPKQAMLRHNTCVICHLLPCKCHSICIICPQICYKCQGACQIFQYFNEGTHLSTNWVNLSYVRLCVSMQVLVSMSMRQPTLFECKCAHTCQPACQYLSKHMNE